ncbi:hypothetical protein PoB_005314200 [Plakobranchus ocellatus]|uniref:Uncharacterized protein n=1 Tax=Plakobranchus ocellatus TaxID=259542 RepID=A0AAV4C4W2_9GAST|nr:hypothetical protein PoB_005314200 [Plakobranchus ocellatus]
MGSNPQQKDPCKAPGGIPSHFINYAIHAITSTTTATTTSTSIYNINTYNKRTYKGSRVFQHLVMEIRQLTVDGAMTLNFDTRPNALLQIPCPDAIGLLRTETILIFSNIKKCPQGT